LSASILKIPANPITETPMSVQDVQNEVKEILSQFAESVRELDFVVYAVLKGIGTSIGVHKWNSGASLTFSTTVLCEVPLTAELYEWVATKGSKRLCHLSVQKSPIGRPFGELVLNHELVANPLRSESLVETFLVQHVTCSDHGDELHQRFGGFRP